jgi:hypothetical protein
MKGKKKRLRPLQWLGPESNGHHLHEHIAVQAINGAQMQTSRYQS